MDETTALALLSEAETLLSNQTEAGDITFVQKALDLVQSVASNLPFKSEGSASGPLRELAAFVCMRWAGLSAEMEQFEVAKQANLQCFDWLVPDVRIPDQLSKLGDGINTASSSFTSDVDFAEMVQPLVQELTALELNAQQRIVCIQTLNTYSVIASREGRIVCALLAAHCAEAIFQHYTRSPSAEVAACDSGASLWLQQHNAKWDEGYIKTTFFLAQLYQIADNPDRTAHYCKLTLDQQRLLEHNPTPAMVQEWIQSSLSLIDYFVNIQEFDQAYHYLAIARELPDKHGFEDQTWFAMVQLRTANVTATQLQTYSNLTGKEARDIFIRGNQACEAALTRCPLDGYVTDHVHLRQEQSKLYRCLIAFEPDIKRQLAMHQRRIDGLEPLLQQISQTVYLTFHKEISFELGEIYLAVADIRRSRIQLKPKPKEIERFNDCIRGAISNFVYFTNLYHDATKQVQCTGKAVPMRDLITQLRRQPNHEDISNEDALAWLTAHFHLCGLLGKHSADASMSKTELLVEAKTHYEWLVEYAPVMLQHKQMGSAVFADHLAVCKEMLELLPAKIDRVHFAHDTTFEFI